MEMGERLSAITQQVGFALWQLQELEGVCATYYVLVEEAELGMGLEAGNNLDEKAKKKTFGQTINKLKTAGLLSPEIEISLKKLLSERNWLVHSSRDSSRRAISSNSHMNTLLERLNLISEEALSLLRHMGKLNESFVKKHGVTEAYIKKKSKEILDQWHSMDTN